MPDLKTLLQLGRVPNVFTAMSNVLGAYLLSHYDLADASAVALLLISTSCLYIAGMVLNDVFDVDIDTQERPERPIPSGRISQAAASRIGWGLLAAGVATAVVLTALRGTPTPAIVAVLLAVAIVGYDAVLKRSAFLGPPTMGLCRALNVLLGLSLVADGWFQWHPMFWCAAGGIGVYVTGLTLFARHEADENAGRGGPLLGMFVMLAGIAVLAYFPQLADHELPTAAEPQLITGTIMWQLMWGIFGFFVVRRCLPALAAPSPATMQFAVKQSIFAMVLFDAAIVTATRGPMPYALVVVALAVPMVLLGRFVYST